MNEQDLMAELDPRELAILDAYRGASEPSPEVEDRLFARLQAAIEIEENTPYHAAASRDVPEEGEAARKGASPVTTVVVAIAAFAAGVALTVGLRGTIAQAVEQSDEGSAAPMVAEDAGPQGTARNAGGQACEVVEVPVRVEVPVPVEVEIDEDDDARDGRDDERRRDESIEDSTAQRGGSGPTDLDGDDDDARRVERKTQMIAVSPWPSTRNGNGDDPPPRHRRRRRRGARATGVNRGSGATGSARPEPNQPSGSSGAGSSGPKSSPGGKPGSKPGSGNGGRGDSDPPPQPGDEPPPPEEPWDDEPPPDDYPPDDPYRCLGEFDQCLIDVQQACEDTGDPDFCMDPYAFCEPYLWECEGDIPPEEPQPPPMWPEECDQQLAECYEFAELECNEAQDPQICDDLFYNCDSMLSECYGEPPPPPMWPEEPPPQDQGDEDPDGHIY